MSLICFTVTFRSRELVCRFESDWPNAWCTDSVYLSCYVGIPPYPETTSPLDVLYYSPL